MIQTESVEARTTYHASTDPLSTTDRTSPARETKTASGSHALMEIPCSKREAVNTYIREVFIDAPGLVPPIVREFEERARVLPIPPHHVSPEIGKMLQVLVRASGARRVLEIGTMWGYSAWWMSQGFDGFDADCAIVTLEKELKHYTLAREFFSAAGIAAHVDVRHCDALQELHAFAPQGADASGIFDFIFLDADKREYPVFFVLCLPLLRRGGLFVIDNVIFSSAWGDVTVADETEDPRISRAQECNRLVVKSEELIAVPLAIGSGVMLAVKN